MPREHCHGNTVSSLRRITETVAVIVVALMVSSPAVLMCEQFTAKPALRVSGFDS